jgi:hypothetical protein
LFFFGFGLLFFLPVIIFIFVAFRIVPRILNSIFREVDSNKRIQGNFSSGPVNQSDKIEHRIFQLAYRLKGRITLSDIIMETGMDMKKAEDTVNSMVDEVRVRMVVDDDGLIIYEFPEIIARCEGGYQI